MIVNIMPLDTSAFEDLNFILTRCEWNIRCTGPSHEFAPVLDTICFATEEFKLRGNGDVAIMKCTYAALKFAHFLDLLKIIHDVSPK